MQNVRNSSVITYMILARTQALLWVRDCLLPGTLMLYQEFGVRSWPNTFRARESP
jgi:hypothetical protein